MAYLSDRNADRCSARHGRAIMRAYLQHAYGARDQLAYGSATTIPHVAPFMRATLATGMQRDYPESRAVHGAGFRVCGPRGRIPQ
jgi:hypothetical protein